MEQDEVMNANIEARRLISDFTEITKSRAIGAECAMKLCTYQMSLFQNEIYWVEVSRQITLIVDTEIRKFSVDKIIDAVCNIVNTYDARAFEFKRNRVQVTVGNIPSRVRSKEYVEARRLISVFNWILNPEVGSSEAGAACGLDHSSVIHHKGKMIDYISSSVHYVKMISKLMDDLGMNSSDRTGFVSELLKEETWFENLKYLYK